MPTAAILVIGNEVLSGKVRDENGPYLVGRLRELGVEVRRIVVVPDEVDVIAEAVASLKGRFASVFTSGGIGPTHDDVTVCGVAKGLGRGVVRHPGIEAKVREHYGTQAPPEVFRLADVPEGAHLVEIQAMWVPAIEVEEFLLLPGVPQLFRHQFDALAERFRGPPIHLRCAYVTAPESQIAAALDRHSAEHPKIRLGSYPQFEHADWRVKLTVEGRSKADVDRAFEDLLALLPAGSVVRTEEPS